MSSSVLQSEVSPDAPTALSFREFRDEEIADFFANGQRTFRPPTGADGGFGRQRIVGSVHHPSERKPTAAFRAAYAAKKQSVLCKFQPSTISLPVAIGESASSTHPFGKQPRSLAAIAMGGQRPSPDVGRAAKVLLDPLAVSKAKTGTSATPCQGSSGIRIDSLGEQTPTSADSGLTKVVERWPRLSPACREVIGTLIETTR